MGDSISRPTRDNCVFTLLHKSPRLAAIMQVEDNGLCQQLDLPGQLLLSVSVDLHHLDSLGTDLRVLDSLDAPVSLVFELTDGTNLVWPGFPEGRNAQMPSEEDPLRQEAGPQDLVSLHYRKTA